MRVVNKEVKELRKKSPDNSLQARDVPGGLRNAGSKYIPY